MKQEYTFRSLTQKFIHGPNTQSENTLQNSPEEVVDLLDHSFLLRYSSSISLAVTENNEVTFGFDDMEGGEGDERVELGDEITDAEPNPFPIWAEEKTRLNLIALENVRSIRLRDRNEKKTATLFFEEHSERGGENLEVIKDYYVSGQDGSRHCLKEDFPLIVGGQPFTQYFTENNVETKGNDVLPLRGFNTSLGDAIFILKYITIGNRDVPYLLIETLTSDTGVIIEKKNSSVSLNLKDCFAVYDPARIHSGELATARELYDMKEGIFAVVSALSKDRDLLIIEHDVEASLIENTRKLKKQIVDTSQDAVVELRKQAEDTMLKNLAELRKRVEDPKQEDIEKLRVRVENSLLANIKELGEQEDLHWSTHDFFSRIITETKHDIRDQVDQENYSFENTQMSFLIGMIADNTLYYATSGNCQLLYLDTRSGILKFITTYPNPLFAHINERFSDDMPATNEAMDKFLRVMRKASTKKEVLIAWQALFNEKLNEAISLEELESQYWDARMEISDGFNLQDVFFNCGSFPISKGGKFLVCNSALLNLSADQIKQILRQTKDAESLVYQINHAIKEVMHVGPANNIKNFRRHISDRKVLVGEIGQ